MQRLGKVSGVLSLMNRQYPNASFHVMPELCADVIVGQEFLKRHASITVVMNGPEESPTINTPMTADPTQLSVAAAKLEAPRFFEFLSPDAKPVASKSRRYSQEDQAFIEAEVGRLRAADVTEPSMSPWRAQVLVVKQKEKKRLVTDYYSTVNRFTVLDAYPLPNIEDLVNKVAQDKYYSSIDLRQAYYQVPLLPEERHFTAFEAAGHLYQHKRLKFGVTNGVSAFQRTVDAFIKNNHLQKMYEYLDDLTVTGATLEEHDRNLKLLLDTASSCNMTLNESKSQLCVRTLDMLGYRVSFQQVQPDPQRLQPLVDLPPPSTPKELQRVSGMFSYYAKWIPRFSQTAGPLLRPAKLPLDGEALSAFNELKKLLSNASLTTIQNGVPFEVETDVSGYAINAILSQGGRSSHLCLVHHIVKKYYPAVEKEATAVIKAIRRWSHFLKGRHFLIITDQRAISFIFDQRNRGKIKNSKILSWRLELSQLSYDIRHKPGAENVVPDAFSRICASTSNATLRDLHQSLGHPGFARLYHFVRQ